MRAVALLVAIMILGACGDAEPDDDRLALDGASSTALLFWTTDGEGSEVPGAEVAEAQQDGDCFGVHLRGTAGGPGQVVALRRPPEGEPVINGWEIVRAGDYSIDQLNGNDKNCGFN